MAFWDDVGNFIGDVTGYKAQQNASQAANNASQRLDEASALNKAQTPGITEARNRNTKEAQFYDQGTRESMGSNAADTMRLANESASKQALDAANAGGGRAAAGARAAGLNPGQAAQMASQGTSQNYEQARQAGVNQYGQAVDRFAGQGNAKQAAANQNINQGIQQAGVQASIATGNTGLANQQQQTANQQGNNFMGFLFSDENLKTGITDLSGAGASEQEEGTGYDKFKKDGGVVGAFKSMFSGGGQGGGIGDLSKMAGAGGGVGAGAGAGAAGGAEAAAGAGGMEAAIAQAAPALMAAFSDKNLKSGTQAKDMGSVLDSLLANVKPVKYRYKPGVETAKPEGTERIGILAQDLEKTPLKDTVVDTPSGKVLDTPQLSANNTAMITELYNRIKALEAGKGA